MANTYYAWSNINTGEVTINVGKEVSQADLDISDSEWDDMIAQGVVRESKYPEGVGATESPSGFLREKLLKAYEGELDDADLKELRTSGVFPELGVEEVPAEAAPAAPKASTAAKS